MRLSIALFVLSALLLTACRRDDRELEGYGPGELKKWNDPNFQIISVRTYNYTNYDLGPVFILPPDKADIDFAALARGGAATPPGAVRWSGVGGGSADLAWDRRWAIPKRFKIWWFRVVDSELIDDDKSDYNMYTEKRTRPGGAYCEYEIEISEKFDELFGPPFPYRKRDELVLYFFPDGTVEGHLEFGADSDIELVDISRRNDLVALKDRPCLKEVANPRFGKKPPISIN